MYCIQMGNNNEISGSYNSKYEDDSLLGVGAV
jgi:hypothetical protein